MSDLDHHGDFKIYDGYGNLIAHGRTPADAFAPLPDSAVRADAEQLLKEAAEAEGLIEHQQEHAAELRQHQLRAIADGLATIGRRLDTIERQRADRARARAADEARRIQQKLDALPDPDDPSAHVEPTGELHQVAASGPATRAQRAAGDQGDLPRAITRQVPPDPGTDPVFDPAELAHGPDPAAPPVAISLNADTD